MKDTIDLYDFETKDIENNSFTLSNETQNSFLITIKDKLQVIKSLHSLNEKTNTPSHKEDIKIISHISFNKNQNCFVLKNPFTLTSLISYYNKTNYERLYKVFNNDEYIEVKEKDVIKLGRVRLKFDKISLNTKVTSNDDNNNINMLNYISNKFNMFETSRNNNELQNSTITSHIHSNINDYNNNMININTSKSTNIKKHRQCRICYSNYSDLSNPLISPCNCIGSMSYIHFQCLKKCISSRIFKKENANYICYFIKNQNCEICLKQYPKVIQYKNNVYNLIDFDFDKFENFVLCDYSIYDESKKQLIHKGYMLINLNNNEEITIGRNQANVIKLKDISVSRTHCALAYVNGKVMLKDKKSKFGSLMYVKDEERVINGKGFEGVCGRHLIKFEVFVKWSLIDLIFGEGCCSCKANANEEEFVVNLERDFQRIKKLPDENIKDNYVNDSYDDYVMKLSNVYIDEDEEENENEDNEINERICGRNHNVYNKNDNNISVNLEL